MGSLQALPSSNLASSWSLCSVCLAPQYVLIHGYSYQPVWKDDGRAADSRFWTQNSGSSACIDLVRGIFYQGHPRIKCGDAALQKPKISAGLAPPAAARYVSYFHHLGAYWSFYNGSHAPKEIESRIHKIPQIQSGFCSVQSSVFL